MFDYKFDVPADDGTVENLVIRLRDFELVPSQIWWEYGDDGERLLKEKLKWGFVDDEAFTNFKRLPESKLPDLFSAWQESAKVTVPESGASSASSTPMVKPSRPTSSESGSD